ncbi:putative methionine ABC transporter ATP-binding protein [Selenomonas ruminantium subsp. lactilytica TAM6421]|uniref:Putative methionine ABC transporter ATP-binding protein n=1 Tax=Selenomonas ruminantium subsp. lactilytica (strain NBRC 103574 / TAM6421) TaxID=927704 RepID=I0GUN0_SELRL|nr:ATP-binding cassette domain-containing protein [Selenomonas ruminantium]BAL84467.1 putative methionine ABC transporter ATP-binding protein [Selenomonas ruminantium subsp. lactilytica TAM6421]
MIVLEGINKTFTIKDKQVTAVKDVNLTIQDKEIYGIIGFSGAGKSTLVRCINLLERPTAGKVIVNGVDMLALQPKDLREQRKKIGMIFQQFNLMPSRTVAQNVALPIENSGLSKSEIESKVKKLLAFVELEDRAHAYPSQLSGGQKQRVAIARALATDPEILLCDEATSALDPQTTRSILKLLARLNTELGITVVVITHEMDVIKKLCHRVAVMEHGRVVEENTVYDLFAQPQQEITKNFIDTTSNLSEIYQLIEDKAEIAELSHDEKLVKMRYQQANVSEPLISQISRKFEVSVNILFSDVELVEGLPLGGTVAIIKGARPQIKKALDYVRAKNVNVEVIKDGAAEYRVSQSHAETA